MKHAEARTHAPQKAEVSWAMVVPKMQRSLPRPSRIVDIPPASTPTPLPQLEAPKIPPTTVRPKKQTKFRAIVATVGSAIAVAVFLALVLHTPPWNHQIAPRPIAQPQGGAERTQQAAGIATASVDTAQAPDKSSSQSEAAARDLRRRASALVRPSRHTVDDSTSELPRTSDSSVLPDRQDAGELQMPEGFEPSSVLTQVKPLYPRTAILARVEGTVRFKATISKDGAIVSLDLISGPPLLAQAAADAVRQWTFTPARLNGDPVEDTTPINVRFELVK